MVTLADVLAARQRIAPHLRPTPLHPYAGLEELVGTEVLVKHENHLPVGAFKVRGGVNLAAQLSGEERAAGLIAASTGNHGQSVAFGARAFGVAARICAPVGSNPVKVRAMRELGAEVIEVGEDFDAAREHCEALAAEHGYRYVHSGNEPHLIAGVATHTLEIFEERPDVDVVIVPVGGGSGAAGACVVARALASGAEVIGVQSAQAPTAREAWAAREHRAGSSATFAEGLATRVAFELPQGIMQQHLSDFVLVDDAEIREATKLMIEHTRNLIEPSGAAPLAAALRLRERLAGRTVALIATGGNVSPAQLRELLA